MHMSETMGAAPTEQPTDDDHDVIEPMEGSADKSILLSPERSKEDLQIEIDRQLQAWEQINKLANAGTQVKTDHQVRRDRVYALYTYIQHLQTEKAAIQSAQYVDTYKDVLDCITRGILKVSDDTKRHFEMIVQQPDRSIEEIDKKIVDAEREKKELEDAIRRSSRW